MRKCSVNFLTPRWSDAYSRNEIGKAELLKLLDTDLARTRNITLVELRHLA